MAAETEESVNKLAELIWSLAERVALVENQVDKLVRNFDAIEDKILLHLASTTSKEIN